MKQLFRMLLPGGLAIAWSASGAQAQSVEPRFEVSSIKASVPGSAIHNPDCSGNRFAAGGLRFAYILRWAYDLQPSTGDEFLQRVPDSIRMKTYEIQARASSAIASESQCRAMVQSLLAERFKLAFHYETRDAELFDLVVARGGPKLQKALATDVGTDINFVLNGLPYTQAPIADAETRAHTKGVTMQELAQWLTGPVAAPQSIADKTGLEGRYKIDLRISTLLPTDGRDVVDPPVDPALAKIGLRLEKHKGSVEVPILDHIESPDAN